VIRIKQRPACQHVRVTINYKCLKYIIISALTNDSKPILRTKVAMYLDFSLLCTFQKYRDTQICTKHVISLHLQFLAGIFTQTRPAWVGDLGTRSESSKN
jgi:hypothetical protein